MHHQQELASVAGIIADPDTPPGFLRRGRVERGVDGREGTGFLAAEEVMHREVGDELCALPEPKRVLGDLVDAVRIVA